MVNNNLVGGLNLPLWRIWVRQLGQLGWWLFPTEWNNKIHVPNHQSDNLSCTPNADLMPRVKRRSNRTSSGDSGHNNLDDVSVSNSNLELCRTDMNWCDCPFWSWTWKKMGDGCPNGGSNCMALTRVGAWHGAMFGQIWKSKKGTRKIPACQPRINTLFWVSLQFQQVDISSIPSGTSVACWKPCPI